MCSLYDSSFYAPLTFRLVVQWTGRCYVALCPSIFHNSYAVDMFAIFSLRRPNILPVGDLGVQRGMLRWFLSRHSSKHPFTLSPHKLSGAKSDTNATERTNTSTMGPPPTPAPRITADSQLTDAEIDNDVLPTFGSSSQSQTPTPAGPADQSSVPPAPLLATPSVASLKSIPALPDPFTPSIDQTLNTDPMNTEPLPDDMSVPVLKARFEGKKIKYVIFVCLFPREPFLIKTL